MKENDNIEKYFQKRLKNDAFSFEEAHWNQLEAQLDKALPTAASAPKVITKSRLILLVLLAAILAFLMGWFFKEVIFEGEMSSQEEINNTEITLNDNQNNESLDQEQFEVLDSITPEVNLNSNSQTEDNSKLTDDSQQAGILNTQQETTNITLDSSTTKNETTTINNLNAQTTEKITNNPVQDREEKNLAVITPDLNITNTEEIEAKRNNQNVINNQNIINNQDAIISQENLLDNNVQKSINNENEESMAVPVEKNDSLLTISPLELQLLTDSSAIPFGLAKGFIVTENAGNSNGTGESLRSKWGLSLTLAPDFSNTSSSDLFSSLGNAVGLRLDYQILPRFRLAVGTTLGRKLYIAPDSDYSPPMGFWTDGVRPEEIDANCLILEIPISVGYHLFNIKRTSVWVNTAIASQFMLREDYDYIYATENPDLVQRWSGRNENNHLFSALSFSISLQRQLLRNWDGFIEPYFGSPLKGIGHGKVNLLGTGVNIGVRYSFNKKAPSI